MLSCLVGGRDAGYAHEFMQDVASRLKNRVQLTTDGHKAYLSAVEDAFGSQVDYAMLVKIYGAGDAERRYSPVECLGAIPTPVTGNPDPKHSETDKGRESSGSGNTDPSPARPTWSGRTSRSECRCADSPA